MSEFATEELEVGDAHSDNAEYYILRRDGQKDVHLCCFGGTSFVRLEDHVEGPGPRTLSTYHLWQLERDGATIEAVSEEDTVWKKVREYRNSRDIHTEVDR